jgi:hypothetical protein
MTPMKDSADWDYILNYTDALFYRLADGISSRANAHEEVWALFEQGCFRLRCGDDDDSVGVLPCESEHDRRAAMEQNKPLACYRQRIIEDAVAAA